MLPRGVTLTVITITTEPGGSGGFKNLKSLPLASFSGAGEKETHQQSMMGKTTKNDEKSNFQNFLQQEIHPEKYRFFLRQNKQC